MINYKNASKPQLLQICLWEDCPLEYRYEAVKELQTRERNGIYESSKAV